MDKKIVWSPLARRKRKEILKFWIGHNKSNAYSIKLNRLFKEAANLVSQHPNIGTPTTDGKVRCKLVRDYLMFYEKKDDQIYILTIWDPRQNPAKFEV